MASPSDDGLRFFFATCFVPFRHCGRIMREAPGQFDPYYKWLGIPAKDQPPNLYRLLGVELFESDAEVIDVAANRQMAYLQSCAAGEHSDQAERLLNEVSAARLCLLNPKKKSAYDAGIRATATISSSPVILEFDSSKLVNGSAAQAVSFQSPISSPLDQLAAASRGNHKRKSTRIIQPNSYWKWTFLLLAPIIGVAIWLAATKPGTEGQALPPSQPHAGEIPIVQSPSGDTATHIRSGDTIPTIPDEQKIADSQPTTSPSTIVSDEPQPSQAHHTTTQDVANTDVTKVGLEGDSSQLPPASQPSTNPNDKHTPAKAPLISRTPVKLVWTPLRASQVVVLIRGEAHIFLNRAKIGEATSTSCTTISVPLNPGDCIVLQAKSQFVNRLFRIGFVTDDGISSELTDVRMLGNADVSSVTSQLVAGSPHAVLRTVETQIDKEWPANVLGSSSTACSIPRKDTWFMFGIIIPETAHLGIRKFQGRPLQSTTNSIGMKFVEIRPGAFLMGSPETEFRRESSETQHKVRLTKTFAIATTSVTQAQWIAVMGSNPSHFVGDDLPVETVNYSDAVEFCRKLSEMDQQAYRLPTEAEWEYACRAGTQSTYNTGTSEQSLSDAAWYHSNSDNKTHPVGQRKPNRFGLYDMHGNVCQWCSDCFENYTPAEVIDPKGPENGTDHVLRGGAWYSTAPFCRSAFRRVYPQGQLDRPDGIGFRVVLECQ